LWDWLWSQHRISRAQRKVGVHVEGESVPSCRSNCAFFECACTLLASLFSYINSAQCTQPSKLTNGSFCRYFPAACNDWLGTSTNHSFRVEGLLLLGLDRTLLCYHAGGTRKRFLFFPFVYYYRNFDRTRRCISLLNIASSACYCF